MGGQKRHALIQSSDMNQSQIASVMVTLPVPLQLFPPTLVLPSFHVVVLQFAATTQLRLPNFVFANDGTGGTLYSSHLSRVTKSQQNQVTLGLFKTLYSP